MKIMNLALILAASVSVATAADSAKNDWPRFRGPTGDGVSLAKGIPTTWSTNQNVLWSVDLPKPLFLRGPYLLKYDSNTKNNTRVVAQDLDLPHAFNPWSSPIIAGDKVFVATSGVKPENHSLLVQPGRWKTTLGNTDTSRANNTHGHETIDQQYLLGEGEGWPETGRHAHFRRVQSCHPMYRWGTGLRDVHVLCSHRSGFSRQDRLAESLGEGN